MLTYEWNSAQSSSSTTRARRQNGSSFDLDPHPADPLAHMAVVTNGTTNGHTNSSGGMKDCVPGHEIYVYVGKIGYDFRSTSILAIV